MRRMFWIGVGVAAAYYGSRWMRRQRDRFSAGRVAGAAGGLTRDVFELARVSVEEGRRAAAEKEAEIRAALGDAALEREPPSPR